MEAVGLIHALTSYMRVRLFPFFYRSRVAVDSWQAKRLSLWIENHVSAVPAFNSRSCSPTTLNDLPHMDKSTLMADFVHYNKAGVTAENGWKAFENSKKIGSYIVGASTGTSGNRGLFIISQRERFLWLGAILAKAVPDFWRHKDRVAVLLPLDTPLYNTANKTSRLQVKFFDISNPLKNLTYGLEEYEPTILIAPPRILRRLAEFNLNLSPRLIFSAAEKLEEFDRAVIEAVFHTRLREIYMATEGLLAVSCARGRLHLSEDCMYFELEDAGNGLVSPVISDFSRTTQIMARYRMNDLLRIDASPCPCGSPLRVVKEIVGRMDDVFYFRDSNERPIEIMPDVVRNTIVDCDRRISDFRIIQTDENNVILRLDKNCPVDIGNIARQRLMDLIESYGCKIGLQLEFADLSEIKPGKLRRVKCELDRNERERRLGEAEIEPVAKNAKVERQRRR